MKKILLFTMMMFIATLVFAQALTEGFETWPPVDWTIVQGPDSPTNDITQTATESYTGSYSARFSSYTSASAYDEYMITPQLVTAVGDQTVSFWYQKSTYGTELFKVGWSSTGMDVATDFTWSDEISDATTDWQQYTKADLPVGTLYVAIHYYSNYQYYMYVDDVAGPELYVVPAAPDPTTLIAPADLASRLPVNGDLSWNAASGADGYYLYFGSDGGGTTDPTDIENGTDLGNVTSYSFTDLGFLTPYYWAVVPYNAFGTTTGYDIWEFETISETAVPFTIDLIDSYGDGWNGGMVDLSVEGVLVLDDITIISGAGPETFTFLVEDDETVLVDYTAGSYPGENSYVIVNEEDVVIYTSPAPPEVSYSFIVGAVVIPNVFFSEYIEGSSNNKAIEIYNGTEETIDLANFVIYGNYNGNPWSEIYPFEAETIVEAGDVYVLANDEADQAILNQADVVFAYGDPWYMTAFNGDDVRALGYIAQGDTIIIDFIGLYDLVDPGDGWEVAGIADATKNHTLVRKDAITLGNTDWVASAGTNADDSEWIVNDEDTFGFLGWHIIEPSYISGVVTLDAFGDVTDTEISVEVGEDVYSVYADETGFYFMNIVPGTYDVVADMPGYDVMTTTGVECVVGVVSTVDFDLIVIPETLWPPVNLTAEVDVSGVNVAWTAPTQWGWNSYYQGPSSLTWVTPERATFYDVTDFGFSYPMELSQLSHGFYHHSAYPWGDDTTFTFKIYDADGTTVLYESEVITALEQWDETLHTLATPITVTDNFWVSVAVTNATTGFPSSLFSGATTNLHGYAGTPGDWGEAEYDWATLVYIMGGEGTELLTYSKEAALPTFSSKVNRRLDSVKIDELAPTDNSRDLLSFNVFRDAVQLNTEPVYDVSYVDLAVPAGEYIYHATALWNFGESDASNTATVNFAFGDLSGTVTDGTDPIEGAIVAAGEYSTATIADGTYLIGDMLIGTYEVTCSAAGFELATPVSAEITDGGNTIIDFSLVAAGGTIAFIDDFEGGPDNWVFEGTWGLTDEGANSPTHSMTESPNEDYGLDWDISSTLAVPWDLSAVFGAELSFWYKSDIETAFDYMYLDISTNGTDWANLATYDEEDGAWQQTTIPIGGFVGVGYETVSIRFHFVSDAGYVTVGMLIDDVILTTYDEDTFPPFIAHTGPEFYTGTPDDYVFDATIIDISGVAEANVIYTVDEGDPLSLPYTSFTGDVYTFTIPAQDAGAQVDYAVEAIDAAAEPNTGLLEGFVYIAGTPFIYDNGFVDFYTVFNEGAGAAELIINPAGNQLNLAYALIRNYTDQSGQDNDPYEFHVWSSVDDLPGVDLITPIIVEPEASYSNTSAMTRIDLRPYATELENIQGNFFIGFLVNQGGEFGKVHCTITQPGSFTNSYTYDGASDTWLFWGDTDLHFRAVAELIPVASGTVNGIVTDGTDPIEGAVVTVGTSSGTTAADGIYSIIADPGTQPVVCVADGYVEFEGSVVVIENDIVEYNIEMELILWVPQNLEATLNVDNVMLTWEVPAPPVGNVMFEDDFETGVFIDEWELVTGASNSWEISDAYAFEGVYGAAVSWGYTIDTWLITPEISVDDDHIVSFAWEGSYYWSVDPNDNCDLFIQVSIDGGTTWDPIWTFGDIGVWDNFTWYETSLDLAAYSGEDVLIGFNVVGNDNADTGIDNVYVGSSSGRTIGTHPISAPARVSMNDKGVLRPAIVETDSRALAHYNIYRDGIYHDSTTGTGLFYLDLAVPGGEYTYNVTAVYEDPDGESEFSNIVNVSIDAGDDILKPTVTALTGNYPNPFNPTTKISFSIKEAGPVSINIYNMRGQLVKTLVNNELENDYYEIVWNGRDNSNKSVASGVYFYKMKTQNYNSTKKMILMK
ncbi:MAG: choice-of-anchor J domain-containing protein [Candidatus Tenebribacter davisii]|nr:choice-of-anchor J domain-containing protein [Candidatus Tenebribacter davisii]